MTDDSSFAARWSRRKQAVKAEEVEEIATEVVAEIPVEDVAGEPEKTDAEVLAEHNLIDPDDMQPGDDFSGFMNSAIPQRLRNRALRKLWLSNPALANLDQLVDYGDDFTDKGGIVEDIVTAYKVGKGYFTETVEEDEEAVSDTESLDETDSTIAEVDSKIPDTSPSSSVRKPEPPRVTEKIVRDTKAVEVIEVAADTTPNRRKRMNYRF